MAAVAEVPEEVRQIVEDRRDVAEKDPMLPSITGVRSASSCSWSGLGGVHLIQVNTGDEKSPH